MKMVFREMERLKFEMEKVRNQCELDRKLNRYKILMA